MEIFVLVLCFVSIIKADPIKAPHFIWTSDSQPSSINIGEDLKLGCSNSQDSEVFWRRENGDLPAKSSQRNAFLSIPNFQPEDSGVYRCRQEESQRFRYIKLEVKNHDPSTTLKPETYEMLPTPSPPCRASSFDAKPIFIQPKMFTSQPGDILVLACHSTINTDILLTWKKVGQSHLPAHVIVRNGILIIKSVGVEDNGRYICESNGQNGVISDSADVSIISMRPRPSEVDSEDIFESASTTNILASRFGSTTDNSTTSANDTAQLTISPNTSKLNLNEGDPLRLVCSTKGAPHRRVHWRKSSQIYNSFSEEGVIQKSSVNSSDAGNYTCVNVAGEIQKTIEVLIHPKVMIVTTETPTSISIPNNSPISSVVTGLSLDDTIPIHRNPTRQYRVRVGGRAEILCDIDYNNQHPMWRRQDGRPMPSHSYPSDNYLFIDRVQKDSAGIYKCSVKDMHGEYSTRAAQLIVQETSQPPQITLSPDTNDVTVYQGDPLDLVCSADGARIQWKKNGVVITSHVDTTATIHKPSASFDDKGTYVCSAYNDAGTRVKSIRVMVRSNPPIQYKVALGDGAKISCEIENAVKVLFWRRQDSRPLPSSSHLTGGDLIIDEVQRDAAGIYECVMREKNNELVMATAEVIIAEPPQISFSPQTPLSVKSGEAVRIYCRASGDQPIHIEWHYENNRPLPNNVQAVENFIRFDRIAMGNSGRYHCTASNRHGNTTRAADITVNLNELNCNDNQFQCRTKCISKVYQCDKVIDCQDGEDEANCDRIASCSPQDFKCRDGKCIQRSKYCNGIFDCAEGEDENDCYDMRRPNRKQNRRQHTTRNPLFW